MSPSTAGHRDSTPGTTQMPDEVPLGGGEVGIVDYTLVIVLTTISILVGTVKAVKKNKENSANDYLLGGRTMSILPVALSLLGGFVSALSMLGNATEVYFYGTQIFFVSLGCLWGILLITKLVLPVLYPLHLVSAYEYLEMRFASPVLRRCASLTQIFNMIFYLGMCLYAPCLTLSTVTRIPTWIAILFNGLLCTIYVTIGGVRAVVYTDVLQTSLMFIGSVIIVSKLAIDFAGLDKVLEIAEKGGRIEFFNMDPNPLVRHTFWSVQAFGSYVMLSLIVFSQAQFQRLISVKSLQAASRVCYLFLIGLVVLWAVFNVSGLVAYAIYADCDPLTAGLVTKKDEILPFLVLDKLGNGDGLVGLFVASVYGGVLSSVSSNANAVAALVWKDFLCDLRLFSKMTDTGSTITIKILSALTGLLSIVMAMLVGRLGSILQVTWSVGAAILSPLDGVFITGITAPWVTTKGAVIGFFTALTFNMLFIVGRLVQGSGSGEPLPLSVEGCQDGLLKNAYYGVYNATHENDSYGAYNVNTTDLTMSFENITMAPTVPSLESEKERSYWAIFDLSYCYLGPLGVLIVFVVASFVSCATGPMDPNIMDPRLVHTGCLRVHRKIWDFAWRLRAPCSQPSEVPDGDEVKEQQNHMIPDLHKASQQQDQKEEHL